MRKWLPMAIRCPVGYEWPPNPLAISQGSLPVPLSGWSSLLTSWLRGTEDDHMETEPAPDEELLGPDGKLLKLRKNYKESRFRLLKLRA